MRGFWTIWLLLFSYATNGQSLVGEYDTRNKSHNNRRHYEKLVLNADSSFSYLTRMEFINISKKGRWSVNNDTLVLNETDVPCQGKILVEETYNKKIPRNKVRFHVTSFQGDDINYHLVLSNKDSTRTIWSMTGTTELRIKRVKDFYFIVNSLVYSPVYEVKSTRSNEFKVKLPDNRFFCNEKWLIRDGAIIPIGWDNQYTKYCLKKTVGETQ